MKKSFFGEDRFGHAAKEAQLADGAATLAEKLGASLLIFATLAVGLYPKLLFDRIMPAVETMRFLRQ